MWGIIKQNTTRLQFLDLYYSLMRTVFISSAVDIFNCAVHYIVNLISVEVCLLQVPSGKADFLYAYLKADEITFTSP